MALFPPPIHEKFGEYNPDTGIFSISQRWLEWLRLLSDRLGVETVTGASGNLVEFDLNLNMVDSNYYVNDSETTANNLWSAQKINATVGNVNGPVSSTDNAIVRWNGAGGTNIQNSSVIIDDSDNISGAPTIDVTTSYKVNGTQVLGAQQTAESDASAPTAYTPHASGSTPVTSNAATDLDTTAAALDTLVDEVDALTTTVNNLLAKLRTHGIIAT
jgi:hypothetical protein